MQWVEVQSFQGVHIQRSRNGATAIAGFRADPRAGVVDPGFRLAGALLRPPAATLLTGLAAAARLSRFPLQLVCPFSVLPDFPRIPQELSSRETARLQTLLASLVEIAPQPSNKVDLPIVPCFEGGTLAPGI